MNNNINMDDYPSASRYYEKITRYRLDLILNEYIVYAYNKYNREGTVVDGIRKVSNQLREFYYGNGGSGNQTAITRDISSTGVGFRELFIKYLDLPTFSFIIDFNIEGYVGKVISSYLGLSNPTQELNQDSNGRGRH